MASPTLDRIRRAGLSVEVAGGGLRVTPREKLSQELRETIVAKWEEVRRELLQEAADEALDLATIDPATGDPNLSAQKPATPGQVKRLRKLAVEPTFGEMRQRVSEIVEKAVERGLTEAGAYVLIGRLGDAIAQERRPSPESPAGDGTCEGCGRMLGPTSKRCGRCKGIRRSRADREHP